MGYWWQISKLPGFAAVNQFISDPRYLRLEHEEKQKTKKKKSKSKRRRSPSSSGSRSKSRCHSRRHRCRRNRHRSLSTQSRSESKASISGKPYKGKYFRSAELPPQATTYAALPLMAVMEALYIIDPVKRPQHQTHKVQHNGGRVSVFFVRTFGAFVPEGGEP